MPNRKPLGQYFTPPTIVRFMLDLVGFQPSWRVIDPACGDGAFLREATERGGTDITGVEIDSEYASQAQQHLPMSAIHCADGLEYTASGFDLVIGNPPFRNQHRTIQSDAFKRSLCAEIGLHTERSIPLEVLFLARFLVLARPSGKVAIILPVGVFAGTRLRFVREYLVQHTTIHAVVQLPPGTFRSTQAQACILYLSREPASPGHQTWLAQVDDIGADALTGMIGHWWMSASSGH